MNHDNLEFNLVNNCQCCGKNMQHFVNLPKFPLTEIYEDATNKYHHKGFISQKLLFCDYCSHMSLNKIINFNNFYTKNDNFTISSFGAIKCLDNFYKFIIKNINKSFDGIIDIGGGNNYLLNKFNFPSKINIDPDAKKSSDIMTKNVFFENYDFTVHKNLNKIVVSSHTIEHLNDPKQLIKKISEILKEDELFFIQIPSLELLVKYMRFDQLCHYHLNYFSLNSIQKLVNKFDLGIIKYEFDEVHFGTIRIMLKKSKKNFVHKDFCKLNMKDTKNAYLDFLKYMKIIDSRLFSMNKIYGFGAGVTVPVLRYYLPSLEKLQCIYDDNPLKHKKRFFNLNVPIKQINKEIYEELKDLNVVVTSISSKMAARHIFAKLVKLDVKNIIFPVSFT